MSSGDKPEINLQISEHASDNDSDDQYIWDRATSKRRRKGYLPLSKVAKIFPDMEPKLLCQLAEMVSFTPLEVLAVVPEATSKQLCKFFDLVDQTKQAPTSDGGCEVKKDKTEATPATSLLDQLRQLDHLR